MNKIHEFLNRIGVDKNIKIENTFDFIKTVQYNAVVSIAYENLDILAKKPLDLCADALFDKIVLNGRGGYCFEVNGLLAWFFRELGFEVREYFARYLRGEADIPMRRHRVLSVKCDDGIYFCDIGIGQSAPRYPVKMQEGFVQEQFGEQYKFERDADLGWVLYDLHNGEWRKFISFTEDMVCDVDFVQPSFYCEAHPQSVFNKAPMLAIKTAVGRKSLDNRDFKVFEHGELVKIEENISDDRFLQVVEKEFNININNLNLK